MKSERYEKGATTMAKTTGAVGMAVIDKLNKIYPGLGDCVVEFPYGDITSRPGLDLKTRQIANVAALVTLGNALPQLKVHVQGALNIGWTETEIKEVILQIAVYAGFPAMLNAMMAAQEVFEQSKSDSK
jgi:4-carboxymuconolactone decarboxylase